MMRAVTSATPPAPNGSTILIGFSGQAAFALRANGASSNAASSNSAVRRAIVSEYPFVHVTLLHASLFLIEPKP